VEERSRIPAPPLGLLVLEARAWVELASLVPALPILQGAPQGDGHPVLVLPGWLASDASTRALRWFLRNRGYHVHGWRLGRNDGPTSAIVAGMAKRLLGLRERHGRTVSLVGWSLGGVYARELARRFPDAVRQVITLASPFRDPQATNALVARLGGGRAPLAPELLARLRSPLPVPTTALYTRTDGIVAWQSCVEPRGPRAESVEVRTSHCGMGHHPATLLVIADRLAQPEGAWRPFAPRGWSRLPWLAAAVA
jgi:pimeloyl-ACP methyl ester carboxylesterase